MSAHSLCLESHRIAFEALKNVTLHYFQGLYRLQDVPGQLAILQKSKTYCQQYAAIDLVSLLSELKSQDETATLDECTLATARREIGYNGNMREQSAYTKTACSIIKKLEKIIPGFEVVLAQALLYWDSAKLSEDLLGSQPSRFLDNLIARYISIRMSGDDYFPMYLLSASFIISRDDALLAKSEFDDKYKRAFEFSLPKTYERVIQLSASTRRNFIDVDMGI